MRALNIRELIALILDHVDYTAGACRPTEMIGAVLPLSVIEQARKAIRRTEIKREASIVPTTPKL